MFPADRVFHAVAGTDVETAAAEVYEFYSGHLYWPDIVRIPNRFTFTILREPVSRVVSQFYYVKGFRRDYLAKNLPHFLDLKDVAFSQYLTMPNYMTGIDNHQTRHFLDSDDILPSGKIADEDSALRKAMDRLDSLDVVGIFECFDISAALIVRKMGLKTPPAIARINVTDENYLNTEIFEKVEKRVTEEDVELIRSMNRLDIALHAHARSRFLAELNAFAPEISAGLFTGLPAA